MTIGAAHNQGVCVWFTGLSGSGKTTTADRVVPLLVAKGRTVTVLDGDVVRSHLSRGLGFSREDRDENVRRVGFVAAEIVRHGGVVVCSLVSPYQAARSQVRGMVEATGGAGSFVEVFVDTPLDVVQQRDVKGLYAATRRGEVEQMTGVTDPYEPPDSPELHLDTVNHTVDENAEHVVAYLDQRLRVVAVAGP
ncbi:MAG: adenylyl-sulfate kinase [Gaiellaceae bacterium]